MKNQTPVFLPEQQKPIDIIDVIRNVRNNLVKDFLDERVLITYLSNQFKIMDLSSIKVEFIKGDLERLLIDPVDVDRYKPIIDNFKATGNPAINEDYEKLFYKEIETVLKKYIYG